MKTAAKIFLWILIILIVLLGILYFASQPLLKGIMDEKLEDARIGGLYKVQAKTAYFDLFNLGISLKEVQLIPDSSAELFELSPQIAYLKVKRVSLSKLDIWNFIENNELKVGKLKIIQPRLNLFFFDRKALPKKEQKPGNDLNAKLEIDGIELREMNIQLHLKNESKITINKFDFEITKPVIHPDLFPDITRAIEYSEVDLQINSLTYENPKSFYDITLQHMEVGDHLKSIKLNGFKVTPKLDKKAFARKHQYQTDRFVIDLEEIGIQNFDFERLISDRVISIENININGLEMEVYRDKDRPFNFQNFPKLPQQQIRGIKQDLEIQNININKANVVYLEKMQNTNKAGRVDFKNLEAKIENFGNTESWSKEREMKLTAKASIYGKTPLFAQMNFPLGSNTFYVSGQVKKSPMYPFNDIVIPNAGVKIESGTINQLDFSFQANNKNSNGEMVFLYDGLGIEILKEKESGEIKERKVLNYLVNKVLLPKQNPNKKGEEYHGVIAFDRDKNKGIFNYLWKSVFSGIKDTFIKDHKDIQDYTIEKEEAKQSKKELRKQKREERKKKRKEKKNK